MWKHNNFINLQLYAPPVTRTIHISVNGSAVDVSFGTFLDWKQNYVELENWLTLPYTYTATNVIWSDGTILQHNGVDVLPTDNVIDDGQYTTRTSVTNYIISDTELTAIADAIRTKADITTKLTLAQIAEKINNLIIVANIDTADKMATLLVAENEGNVYKYVGTTTSDYINGDLYVVEAAPSSGETWLLNETIPTTSQGTGGYNTNFVSNGTTYTYINFDGKPNGIRYSNSTDEILAYSWVDNAWTNTAYRTITFATSPTGDLLTWLQANGTKQGGTTGHTLTFSGVTVKVDGTPVTSPYALTKDCTIVATANTANYEVVVTAGSIEHHTDVDGNTLALADTDINIAEANVGATKMNNITISYTAGGEVIPVGYKLTLTNIYLNAGNTVTIHMNNVDGTSTAVNTLSNGMSWDNVVSFWITDTYNGRKAVTINGADAATPTEASPYTLTQDTTFTFDNACLTADMLVTLADGSEKQICELTPDDTYITYDFATGDLATAPAEYIDAVNGHSGKFASQYQKYTFEDGTVIKEVNKHRFLNLRKMEFINLCHWEIGDRIYKIDGTTPALVSKETIVGEVEHFTVTTSKYHNGFVQGCLYGDRYTQKYEIKMVDGKPVYDFSKPHTVDYLYGKVPYSD